MILLTDEGDLVLDGLDELVSEGRLKVVALNLVSNALGTVNGVERITDWAHGHGAIVVLDAAQAALTAPSTCRPSAATSSPSRGTRCARRAASAPWGRAELLERMEPFMLGGHMIRKVQADERRGAISRTSSRQAPRRWPRRSGWEPPSTTSPPSASRQSNSTSTT